MTIGFPWDEILKNTAEVKAFMKKKEWALVIQALHLSEPGTERSQPWLCNKYYAQLTAILTVGQRKKVTAVTFFRCPTVILAVYSDLRIKFEGNTNTYVFLFINF